MKSSYFMVKLLFLSYCQAVMFGLPAKSNIVNFSGLGQGVMLSGYVGRLIHKKALEAICRL